MRRLRWSLVLYSLLGIGALVGLIMLMGLVSDKSDAQVCAALKVIIKGKETFIDQQDIAKLISDNHGMVIGRKLNSIEIGKIESTLKALPYVADASVHTDMDGL